VGQRKAIERIEKANRRIKRGAKGGSVEGIDKGIQR
jgi:hypothetical protein